MTLSLRWKCAVLLLVRVDIVSARAALTFPQTATCVLGQVTPTDSQPVDGLRIECPQDTLLQQVGRRAPEDPTDAEVLTRADGGSVSLLRTLLPTATYVQVEEGDVSVNTLTVSQLPGKPVHLYFECRHNNKAESCYVQVNILPAHRLGPNVCKQLGSRINFAVHAENEKVMFKCGTGLVLRPVNATTVYDGNCINTIQLDTVLPASKFSRAQTFSRAHTDESNILVVMYLPPQPQSLCFICAPMFSLQRNDKKCFVRITTVAGSGAPPPRVRSASMSVTGHTAFALELLLLGVGHLDFR